MLHPFVRKKKRRGARLLGVDVLGIFFLLRLDM
jgi:hypothetical protein